MRSDSMFENKLERKKIKFENLVWLNGKLFCKKKWVESVEQTFSFNGSFLKKISLKFKVCAVRLKSTYSLWILNLDFLENETPNGEILLCIFYLLFDEESPPFWLYRTFRNTWYMLIINARYRFN